jgi:OOP family OmpA-OmpF porin
MGRARIYGANFDPDSDRLKEDSRPTLDRIVATLKKHPDWRLTIEGHTDSTSTPEHNKSLSERRAVALKNYLQASGIDPSRLTTVGYGSTKPVAGNETPVGRAMNRRVELVKQ